MIVLLRGHIRTAFDNVSLYNLLKKLDAISPLKIYIHTWGIQQNSISWRPFRTNTTQITEAKIRTYLRDLADRIHTVLIDPDGSVPLIGPVDGILPRSRMPRLGWKNMWAGMYRIMSVIRTNHTDSELVLNTRFDICNNSNVFGDRLLIDLYTAAEKQQPTTIQFLKKELFNGCDNYFIGPVVRMNALIESFHLRLESTLGQHPVCGNHEQYVMLEAQRLEKRD